MGQVEHGGSNFVLGYAFGFANLSLKVLHKDHLDENLDEGVSDLEKVNLYLLFLLKFPPPLFPEGFPPFF